VSNRVSIILAASAALAMVLALAGSVLGAPVTKVTFQKGEVLVASGKNGPWIELRKGVPVAEGKFIKTGKDGVVELTLPDNSVLRLAPNTLFKLNQALFPKKKSFHFSCKIFLGTIWAKITRAFGQVRGTFNTQTPTAVAGVRGTAYNLKVAADKSTDISVYEGEVGVQPPLIVEGGPKQEVEWPAEVSEKKWEEIILRQFQRLHIGPDARPGKPESFDPEEEKDAWIIWNQERDTREK
jgi:ferric-dicitrate binding protein FerR (iron transport regulator)